MNTRLGMGCIVLRLRQELKATRLALACEHENLPRTTSSCLTTLKALPLPTLALQHGALAWLGTATEQRSDRDNRRSTKKRQVCEAGQTCSALPRTPAA